MAEKSLQQLIHDAVADISSIIRDTIALAKAELSANGKHIAAGIGLFVAGGFVGLVAVLLIIITIAQLLIFWGLAAWFAYLIDAVFFLIIAGILFLIGKRALKKTSGLKQTSAAIKGTMEALKKPADQD